MPIISIRPATPEDREFVLATADRLAEFGPPPSRPAHELVAGEVRTLRRFFEAPLPGTRLLLAESAEGERLGFAYLEPLTDYFTGEEHGHLGMLAVAQAAEGRGVGSTLMRTAEEWCREKRYRRLTLTVFESNRGARSVYEHLGYAAETIRYVKLFLND